jgi:hypothetical protein
MLAYRASTATHPMGRQEPPEGPGAFSRQPRCASLMVRGTTARHAPCWRKKSLRLNGSISAGSGIRSWQPVVTRANRAAAAGRPVPRQPCCIAKTSRNRTVECRGRATVPAAPASPFHHCGKSGASGLYVANQIVRVANARLDSIFPDKLSQCGRLGVANCAVHIKLFSVN